MAKELRRDERPGLYCVELRTENWPRLVKWYREVLGLRVLVRVIDDGYALLEAGETRLALYRARVDGRHVATHQPGIRGGRRAATVRPALGAAGRRVSRPSRDQEGLREANTADPDGNRIRLFSWPKRA